MQKQEQHGMHHPRNQAEPHSHDVGHHNDDPCHQPSCRPFTARALREGFPESLLKDGDAFADDDHRVRQLRRICKEQVQQEAEYDR